MSIQKDLTKSYFNERSEAWAESVYNPNNRFNRFPTSLVRDGIITGLLKQNENTNSVIDFGCGSGEMMCNLLGERYDVAGFDIAEGMVSLARDKISKTEKSNSTNRVWIDDVETYRTSRKYDAAIATGIIEYMEEDLPLLASMSEAVKLGGRVFVACRNKLFNVTTANDYTLELLNNGTLCEKIGEISEVGLFSDVQFEDSVRLQESVVNNFSMVSERFNELVEHEAIDEIQDFPEKMTRRFHSPLEMRALGKEVKLVLENVVYFHIHPFPPKFEKAFPALYNALSLALQPLGQTALGAHIGSGFVAVYQKSN